MKTTDKRDKALFSAGIVMLAAGLMFASAGGADAAPKRNVVLAIDVESYLEMGTTQADLLLQFKPLEDYLEKEIGKKVDIYPVTEQAAITEALRAGKADVSSFSPYRYVLATKRVDMEPIVYQADPKTGKLAFYYSLILSSPTSGLNSLADVKAKCRDLTFAFQDPASTSGTFIPKINLIKAGVNPDTDFREVTSGGEDVVVCQAVKTGKVSLCAVSDGAYDKFIKAGTIKADDVKIVFKSDPILKIVVGVRKALDADLKKALQKAYVEMPAKSQEALALATGSAWGGGSFPYMAADEETNKKLQEYSDIAKRNGL
jgi:phosphonate transport system substrate-binding protein